MGQTNLLLLVLATLVVGLAIISGIQIYHTHVRATNENAIRRDILMMMNAAAEWYTRPAIFKGGGRSFDNLSTFADLGYYHNADHTPTEGTTFYNNNGTFRMIPGDGDLTILGELEQDEDVFVAYKIYADKINFSLEIVEVTDELKDM